MVSNRNINNSLYFDDTTTYTEVFNKDYLERLKNDIENMLSTFTNLQKEIFIRRFGFFENEPQLFQEIADELKCEKGNVWNIYSRKINQIKKKDKILREYDSYGIDEIDINSPQYGKRKVRK